MHSSRVVLVATHGDVANCGRNIRGEMVSLDAHNLLAEVQENFQADFEIADRVFIMDAHLAMAVDIKAYKLYLAELKCEIVKVCLSAVLV